MKYVYYPCAGYDGSAVKIFGKECDVFIYVDCSYTKESIAQALRAQGFRGYGRIALGKECEIQQLMSTLEDCLLVESFERLEGFSSDHGPDRFQIAFVKGDGVHSLAPLVQSLGALPYAMVYIRPGISFGHNRSSFPSELDQEFMRLGGSELVAYDWGCSEGDPSDLPMTREAYSSKIRKVLCSSDYEAKVIVTIACKPRYVCL